MRAAVDELKKAAPTTAPSGPAASGDVSAPSGLAASGDVTALSGPAASGDVTAPSGPAASGYVAATRTAQPPRGPVLAPAKGAQDVKAPGEAAEEALRIKCPVGQGTTLSQRYKFPKRLRLRGDPNRLEDWEQDWPVHLTCQKVTRLPYKSASDKELVLHGFLRPFTVASGELYRHMMLTNEYPGEEGRAARVAQGDNPARSKHF
eukprot:9472681-Pyramimonas_sp.AAC.1